MTDIRSALDPRRSAVVEACAGSGKTWLLVSRILLALLDGCAPGEVLAITYTRKAAREIEQRLHEWLRHLVLADDAGARSFLIDRGVPERLARQQLAQARGLYEHVLTASAPMSISTFHGWFAGLLRAAPLASGLAGMQLTEAGARVLSESWQLFAQHCAQRPQSEETRSLLWLFEQIGAENTRALLFRFIARRAEWHAYTEGNPSALACALAALRSELGVGEEPCAAQELFADPSAVETLREYAGLLQVNTPKDRKLASELNEALATSLPDQAFHRLQRVFFAGGGALRRREASATQVTRLGVAGERRLLDLHAQLGERLTRIAARRCEERAYVFNRHALTVGVAVLEQMECYKRERRILDFEDLEWHADALLRDEATAAFLQARLDARYRHILIDEFQDTNPLQWRILLGWLGAYSEDMEAPKVFIVGDPKQSIYRFRRAEPRIFRAAEALLVQRFGARRFDSDTTWRNSPRLVDVVNRVFAAEPLFDRFVEHRSHDPTLPGRVELLSLCAEREPESSGTSKAGPPRNPLTGGRSVVEDRRHRDEAQAVVTRITEIVGCWQVRDGASMRPAGYDDVLILARRREALVEPERALRMAGIPYLSMSRGGLLQTLEALDLQALLRFLSTPSDDLSLAHVLRSPMFAASDDGLFLLTAAGGRDWWAALQRLVVSGGAPDELARAHRLLASWLELSARLPVHDLLDRIHHEAEAFTRYQEHVPPAAWPGVRANLEAFIALALQLDSGRFPSLPRFVDELARLMQADEQEAPDEGLLGFEREGGGRVRLMTIHAAKGLEAPLVFLVDANAAHRTSDAYQVLLDWPAEAQRPRHFSLVTRKAEVGERRQTLFEGEKAAAEREELNLLYVALTRAKQYFFASGIVARKSSREMSGYERIAAALQDLCGSPLAYGDEPQRGQAAAAVSAPEHSPASPQAALEAVEPVGVRRAAATPGTDYGVRLHELLERLSTGATIPRRAPAGVVEAQWLSLRETAGRIFSAPALQPFFRSEAFRRAMNEVEYALPDGTVGRIDRLVVTEEAVWVLDYKSGNSRTGHLAEYRAQLEGYRAAVSRLFPGQAIRCALIFGDAEMLEVTPHGPFPAGDIGIP